MREALQVACQRAKACTRNTLSACCLTMPVNCWQMKLQRQTTCKRMELVCDHQLESFVTWGLSRFCASAAGE